MEDTESINAAPRPFMCVALNLTPPPQPTPQPTPSTHPSSPHSSASTSLFLPSLLVAKIYFVQISTHQIAFGFNSEILTVKNNLILSGLLLEDPEAWLIRGRDPVTLEVVRLIDGASRANPMQCLMIMVFMKCQQAYFWEEKECYQAVVD